VASLQLLPAPDPAHHLTTNHRANTSFVLQLSFLRKSERLMVFAGESEAS
jgi:hypothetical protein